MDILGNDPAECYVCGGTATEFVEFKSKDRHTKMHLCLKHFDGLRGTLQGYIRDEKRPPQANPAG